METVVIHQPGVGTPSRHGDDEPDWTASSDTPVSALVAPQMAGEVTPLGRQGVPGNLTLYLAEGCGIAASSRVTVRDKTYEVDGEPAEWRSGFRASQRFGVVVDLRRMEG